MTLATCRLIQEVVAERFDLSIADLVGDDKSSTLWEPRRIAIWLCRRHTGLSLEKIGEAFGGRTPGAIYTAAERVDHRRPDDPDLNAAIKELQLAVQTSLAMLSGLNLTGPEDINPIEVARRIASHGSAATRISVLEVRALAFAVIAASQTGRVEICGADDPPLLAAAKAVVTARRKLDQDLYTPFEAAARHRLQESLAELAEAVERAAVQPQEDAATDDLPNPLITDLFGDPAPRRSVF